MTETTYSAEFILPSNEFDIFKRYKSTAIDPFHGTVEFEIGKVVVTLRTTTTNPFDNRFLTVHETVWICSREMLNEKFEITNQLNTRFAQIAPKK